MKGCLSGVAGDPEMAELAKEEIQGLNSELSRLTSQLKVLLLPRDPLDEKNIMLEVRTLQHFRTRSGRSVHMYMLSRLGSSMKHIL